MRRSYAPAAAASSSVSTWITLSHQPARKGTITRRRMGRRRPRTIRAAPYSATRATANPYAARQHYPQRTWRSNAGGPNPAATAAATKGKSTSMLPALAGGQAPTAARDNVCEGARRSAASTPHSMLSPLVASGWTGCHGTSPSHSLPLRLNFHPPHTARLLTWLPGFYSGITNTLLVSRG